MKYSLVTSLVNLPNETESRKDNKFYKKKSWRRWKAMVPHPFPLPCVLALPPTSHQNATTPSPCLAPHYMTQERLMLLNPTPSEPRLTPVATMSDNMLWALTPSLHSILQPATPPHIVAFESWTISASICHNHVQS